MLVSWIEVLSRFAKVSSLFSAAGPTTKHFSLLGDQASLRAWILLPLSLAPKSFLRSDLSQRSFQEAVLPLWEGLFFVQLAFSASFLCSDGSSCAWRREEESDPGRTENADDKNAGTSVCLLSLSRTPLFEGLVALSRGGTSFVILTVRSSPSTRCRLGCVTAFALFFSLFGRPRSTRWGPPLTPVRRRLLPRRPLPKRMGDACVVFPCTDSCLLRVVGQL